MAADFAPASASSGIGRSELVRLTAAKGVTNTGWRWLPFFLPTLALAFDSSTAVLALLLGVAEAGGIATLVAGRWLDAGRERSVIMVALGTVIAGSLVALQGTIWSFAVAAVLLGAGSAFVAVGGHAWISARVPFDRRARFIGVYEMSWASALLVGAPIVAVVITWFGWRGPFIAVAIAGLVAVVGVATIADRATTGGPPPVPQVRGRRVKLTGDAWLIIAISAAIAMAGLTTIAVAGTWLDEALGVSTGGVGLVAMSFGVAELTASSSSSIFADRRGKRFTMQVAAVAVLAGLAIMSSAGSSLLVGAIGLLLFFLGFEYAIVTSFSLVSEAMVEARGHVLGVNTAVGTVARGSGVAAAGILYERFGIAGPAALSAIGAGLGLVLLTVLARRRPDLA
ncbi:MAG: MFS transporter [Actinomycetota bacterium]